MRLKVKDIAIIKKADVEFAGLTVIAGENDTGKSTIGKVLYSIIRTLPYSNKYIGTHNNTIEERPPKVFNKYIKKIFKSQLSDKGCIEFQENGDVFSIDIKKNKCTKFTTPERYKAEHIDRYRAILIETPSIWNLFSTLKTINNLEARDTVIDFEVPLAIQDLYFALTTTFKENNISISSDIKSIIKGEFTEDAIGGYTFSKGKESFELINTAMGIKYFGLLQVLSDNNHLYKNQILILDEPEVHLHPKWQLELAKIIVELVKNGVIILVNSHSPYMIEALQRYAKREKISNHFYLAENGYILEDEDSLSKIFSKLSEPFREFDKMDSEIFYE